MPQTALESEFKFKSYFLYLLLLLDLVLNGLVESEEKKGIALGLVGAQVFFRLVSFFQLFLVLSGTFVFRYGLLGVLFSRFKYTFVMAIIGFFVTVGFRVLRVIHILDGKDVVEIWDDSLYEALFYVHCFTMVGWYVAIVRTSQELGDPNLYKPSAWLE